MALSELTDPQAVRDAIDEFDRLSGPVFRDHYRYGKSKKYMLRTENGQLYDSKAIAGRAFGYQFPDQGPLKAAEFVGGENTVQKKLEELGFEVVRIGEVWSRDEVERTVGDYLDMLALEASGVAYNKSNHNESLRRHLTARTKASVELKHQNISAVLDELGLPFIQGYKPRSNVQALLREVVVQSVRARHALLAKILDDYQATPSPSGPNYRAVLVEAPRPAATYPVPSPRDRIPRKLDFAERDDRNRTLGREGESWTLGHERFRLGDARRSDLAARVLWVSDSEGDGTGYDIASFDEDGATRFVEVKTTNGGSSTPFVVTRNEVEFSQEAGPAFHLYRLFAFASAPRLFILRGALTDTVELVELNYRARLRSL
jgi:hypothetical protein